jgi:hypothetical protein
VVHQPTLAPHGFTDRRIPESEMGRLIRRAAWQRPHPYEPARFDKAK